MKLKYLVLLLPLVAFMAADARLSPPGNVIFSSPNSPTTTAIFPSSGTWVLQDCVSDGVLSQCAQTTVTVNASISMPNLAVGSSAAIAGNSLAIPISFNTGTAAVAGLQFDLPLPAGVTSGTVLAGAAATAAGKGVQANMVGTALRVIVFGVNQNVMGSGQVAIVTLQLSAGVPAGALALPLTNVSATDINGANVPMAASVSGSITVTANKAPVVTLGANQTITLPASATLTATATDDGAPNPPGALTHAWSTL